MQIFIPSMKRVGLQYTLKEIAPISPFPISLVVPHNEYEDYVRQYGESYVVAVPEEIQGISATRQHIMTDLAHHDCVVMMDDDLTFAMRRDDEPEKFREPQQGELEQVLIDLDNQLKKFAHASISTREGGNRNTERYTRCTRVTRVIGYNRLAFLREGVDFRNSTVMDDFEATLHLLTRGNENIVLNYVVQNQKGSGTAGGASTYRTLQMQSDAAYTLQLRYPRFVKTVQKTTKTAWGGATRTDVIIQWKKALAYGTSNL